MHEYERRWWLIEDPDEYQQSVIRLVRELDEDLADKRERMMRCARLYDPNSEFPGAELDLRVGPYPVEKFGGPVTMNIARSVIDTVASMIAKNRPRAAFVTDGANFSTIQKAKDLEKFIEGEFQRTQIYDDMVRVFRDACVVGTGFLKVYEDNGRANTERTPWWEITVDEAECLAGPPRQLHQTRFVDRALLKEMYPDFAEQLDKACVTDDMRQWSSIRRVAQNLVPVTESWHLRSTPTSNDGIHSIVADGVVLVGPEPYERDYFPFVIYRWSERVNGFWGCGLAEDLAGIQNRINKLNSYIGRAHDYANSFVVVDAADAGLRLKMSAGLPWQLVPTRGQKRPEFVTPAVVQPELYQHLQYLVSIAYQIAGVSELSAQSLKPQGLESGIALQTYSDLEGQRFSLPAQRYEGGFKEAARQYVQVQKEISANGGDPEAVWWTGNVRKRIKWSDVDLDEDLYTISIEAASLLSRTPAGRIQAAIELGNAALFDRDELRELIGHPDLEKQLSLKNAARTHASAICERLRKGIYVPPEPLDNLPVAIPIVSNDFMNVKDMEDVPEDTLETYRLWLRMAVSAAQPPQPPAPQPDPAAMMPQPPAPLPIQPLPQQPAVAA